MTAMQSDDAALRGRDLTFGYRRDRTVIEGLSLTLDAGLLGFVIGANGSGKSTLLSLLAGLLTPQAGSVECLGRAIRAWPRRLLARELAFVPQSAPTDFPFTAIDVVLQGRHPYAGLLGGVTTADRALAIGALEELGIGHLAKRSITTLSGGEAQLVHIAAALAQEPRVLLLDEPTASLDPAHVQGLYRSLRARAGAGMAVLVVSHDLNEAATFASRILALRAGGIIADGAPVDVLSSAILQDVYEVELDVQQTEAGRPLVLFQS